MKTGCGGARRGLATSAGAALIWALAAPPGAAFAADVAYRDTLEKAVTFAPEMPAEEVNFFDVFAGAAETYDTNLFRLPSGIDVAALVGPGASRQDHIATGSAGLDGQWYVGRQQILLNARVDDNRFAQNSDLNNVSGLGSLTWNWEFGPYLSGHCAFEPPRDHPGSWHGKEGRE